MRQDSRYASAHATATTARDACRPPTLPPPRQVAHQAPQRSRKRHSHRWFVAWLRHLVRQTLVVWVVALLVVSASGIVTGIVGVDESGASATMR